MEINELRKCSGLCSFAPYILAVFPPFSPPFTSLSQQEAIIIFLTGCNYSLLKPFHILTDDSLPCMCMQCMLDCE